jgi:VCBS repeat-containing protein
LTVDSFDGTAHTISTVTINVTPVNDAPTISGATATGSVPSSALTATAASYLTANHNLSNGLGGTAGFGENILARNDDSSTAAINIDAVFNGGLNFFGHIFHSLYVNNNGNITFNAPSSTFTPDVINAGLNNPIIAPFWADVDTRGGPAHATPPGNSNSTGSNLVYYDLDTTNHVLTVTWDDVGFFSSHTNALNAFQLQLIGLGNGDFDIVFRYESINWTTGTSSGGDNNGLGGTPARAGYSAGDGNASHSAELPQSGNQNNMLNLESTNGNTNIAGVFVFQVQSGTVTTAPVANGTIQFTDPDAGDTHTATALPVGSGYLGTFSLDPVNDATDSVAWHFTLNSNDVSAFFNPGGQVRQQFYNVSISDGHLNSSVVERVGLSVATTASDTFAFSPGAGQELVFNFATSGSEDRIDLRNFTAVNASNIAIQSINSAHDTFVDLGHGDSVTLVGVDLTQQANPSHYFMLHA